MLYKQNLWGTIARKRNYYKAPLTNFSALRPVHSVQTGSVSVTSLNPCLLAMTKEFSDARCVKYVITTRM